MSEHRHWLLPEGIGETLPPQAQSLERLRRILLDLYQSWGYELIFPPFVEYLESLLTGTGGDLDLQTFKLTDQVTGRTLGIRADITPQAARIDAHQLRRDCPTRLCYLGTVLASRASALSVSRSPLQIGAELYGHSSVEAELEILCLMIETLRRSGISDLHLDLGHVGIYRGLARQAGLNKHQELALFAALQRKAVPEIESLVRNFKLDSAISGMLVCLAELSGEGALHAASDHLKDGCTEVLEAVSQLQQLDTLLRERHPDLPVHYDLAELRGYHYHTGVVFAAFVPAMGQELARGGRYDDIGRVFGRARPACGFSADLNVLLDLGRVEPSTAEPTIFAAFDRDPGLRERVMALRASGRRVIEALPGQTAGAKEMGCGEILNKKDGHWVIVPV